MQPHTFERLVDTHGLDLSMRHMPLSSTSSTGTGGATHARDLHFDNINDSTIHNLSDIDDLEPFICAVHVPACMRSVREPDSFFALAESRSTFRRPALLIFASRDETLAGRFACVQHDGLVIAVTIVDSRLNEPSLVSMVGEMYHEMHQLDRHVRSLFEIYDAFQPGDHRASACHELLSYVSSNIASHADRAVDNVVDRISTANRGRHPCNAAALEGVHHPDIPFLSGWSSPQLSTPTNNLAVEGTVRAPPSFDALVAGGSVPGPIATYTCSLQGELPPGSMFTAATVMGGDVAIACVGDSSHVSTARQFLNGHGGVRVVIVVCHAIACDPDLHASLNLCSINNALCVELYGIPVTHVMTVLEDATKLALACRRRIIEDGVWCDQEKLRTLLMHPCNRWTQLRVITRSLARQRAIRAVDRATTSNLDRIKAKLWRPDGRLVANMVGEHVLLNMCS